MNFFLATDRPEKRRELEREVQMKLIYIGVEEKRSNRIRKWGRFGLGLWMGSHFCWFYTTH
jgi:hypothetical protein